MSQPNCNTTSHRFKHLTERERYQIEILLKERRTPKEIAMVLCKHKRTIEREIARGTVKMMNTDLTIKLQYCADTAQMVSFRNACNKGAGLKIGHDHKLAQYIEKKIIKDKYSPDSVIGEIREKGLKFSTSICTKTLYNYIDKKVFANISNKDLPVKRNPKKGNYHRVRVAHNNLKGTSIEERPKEIETRKEYGHWEMDLVEGRRGGSGAVLLVLTERSSRVEIIRKLPDKTQGSVHQALDKLERQQKKGFYKRFKTITVDNGSEFLNSKVLERSVKRPGIKRFKLYYAHI